MTGSAKQSSFLCIHKKAGSLRRFAPRNDVERGMRYLTASAATNNTNAAVDAIVRT
jgi:hypothetical protein